MTRFLLAFAASVFLCSPVSAGPEEGLFNAAKTMIANAQSQPDDIRLSTYRSAKDLLDIVVSSYGSSEIGQGIASGAVVQGIDVGALNAAVQNGSIDPGKPVLIDLGSTIVTAVAPADPAAPGNGSRPSASTQGDAVAPVPLVTPEHVGLPGEAAPTVAVVLPSEPDTGAASSGDDAAPVVPRSLPLPEAQATFVEPGTEATEAALDLGKPEFRDIQARLLVLGHDPNGIDGLAGRGTRSALRLWQAENAVEGSGYLSASQLSLLREQSEQQLAAWLQEPGNAALYDPPVIALTPQTMSGNWRFTSTCGANSRLGRMTLTGILNIRHAGGNQFTGSARQSQGFNGRFAGRLQGRQIVGEINWGLLVGRTAFRGTVADERLVISGSDSNRCGFSARKS
jgi:peptidoglycan hydrolase-like protein with peptidoglycan-binding domain